MHQSPPPHVLPRFPDVSNHWGGLEAVVISKVGWMDNSCKEEQSSTHPLHLWGNSRYLHLQYTQHVAKWGHLCAVHMLHSGMFSNRTMKWNMACCQAVITLLKSNKTQHLLPFVWSRLSLGKLRMKETSEIKIDTNWFVCLDSYTYSSHENVSCCFWFFRTLLILDINEKVCVKAQCRNKWLAMHSAKIRFIIVAMHIWWMVFMRNISQWIFLHVLVFCSPTHT